MEISIINTPQPTLTSEGSRAPVCGGHGFWGRSQRLARCLRLLPSSFSLEQHAECKSWRPCTNGGASVCPQRIIELLFHSLAPCVTARGEGTKPTNLPGSDKSARRWWRPRCGPWPNSMLCTRLKASLGQNAELSACWCCHDFFEVRMLEASWVVGWWRCTC